MISAGGILLLKVFLFMVLSHIEWVN
jgi:hypothetical protein